MKLRPRSKLLLLTGALLLLLMIGCSSIERRLLFFPSHDAQHPDDPLKPWTHQGQTLGVSHEVKSPRNIWLMMHGNAGQARDREYALPSFSPHDSIYILEYPGYGQRPGVPSLQSINTAATEAYQLLRQRFPTNPICALGESIGTGPASHLATLPQPPDKIILITPFAILADVARDHFPSIIVKLLLRQNWNNLQSLQHFKGPVDIFAASEDNIIPPKHARALANKIPHAKFHLIPCGHNDWSDSNLQIRNP